MVGDCGVLHDLEGISESENTSFSGSFNSHSSSNEEEEEVEGKRKKPREPPFSFADEYKEIFCFGTFTNWNGRQMKPFLQYIESIDSSKPDFLADTMSSMNSEPRKVQKVQDLTYHEYKAYL